MKTKALSLLFAALLPLAALAAVWQDPQTKVNYEYTVGSGVASVAEGSWDFAGSPDATGNITILSQITVDGQTYAVTRIGFQAFYGCEGLTDAAIPASIVSIGHNAFKGTAWYEAQSGDILYLDGWALGYKGFSLEDDLVLEKGTRGIADCAFYYTDITSVDIPASVTAIGVKAFHGCTDIVRVTARMQNPPVINANAFGCYNTATLQVPAGAKAKYQAAAPWSQFSVIEELGQKQSVPAQALVLHHSNGMTTEIDLSAMPTVTFSSDKVVIASDAGREEYEKNDILRITYQYLRADVNGDGAVNVADIASVIDVMAGGSAGVSPAEADVNGDGSVDVADISSVIDQMAELARRAVADGTSALPEAVNGTIGEAFYIYRNDGLFNAFFRDEIDSIGFSRYDAGGLRYKKIASQVVYTPDSTYMIPLTAIDSVGFVQPENVLKPDVVSLTGTILDYLVKYEGACLYFLDTMPSSIQPRVGDRLVTIEMTEMFPVGFFGEVVSVTREGGYLVVECSTLEIEDVFESYSYSVVISSEDGETSNARGESKPIDRHVTIPTLSHSWSIGGGYSIFSVSNTVEASLSPKFHIKGNDIVDPVRGRQTDIRVTCNYTTGLKYEFGIEASPSPFDFPFPGGRGEEPIAPALSFFWDFGVFAAVSGSLTYSQSFTQDYVSHLDYKREGAKMPTINFGRPSLVGGQHSEPRIALKGSVRGGFYGELGIKPWAVDKNMLGKVSGRLEIGVEAEMERGIDLGGLQNADRNTALYDFVDHASDLTLPTLTISPYASVAVTVAVGPWHLDWTPWKGKIGSPFYQGGFFPHFSNTAYVRSDGGIKFTSDLSRTCPIPWQIGYSVFDMDDNLVKTEYYRQTYEIPTQFNTYDVTIGGLSNDGEYKVYPCINVFNHPVLASPYVTVRPCPVKLSDFKVTNKQHKERGFTNDGLSYDYRFDVTVTARLEDGDNVHDWGYVYRDPNGRDKEISLVKPSNYGTSYTDSRWAYYRNGTPPFTCTLIPYVKYVDSDEAVYGEPHDYPLEYGETSCPDENHPHMIDLGLPSGTKWACCNVGASMPEGYGNYYAWGETSPKSVYNGDTYQYGYYNYDGDYSHLVNIGSDIAGTGYDAATANWGSPWRMPSLAQIQELLNNTTSTWTTQNGVNGRKFTGSNGGTVFLPAAGRRWNDELDYAGSYGFFWSSSLYESYPGDACGLYFLSGNAGWDYYCRLYGRTVRPVR